MAVENNEQFKNKFADFDADNRERFNDALHEAEASGVAYKVSGSEGDGVGNDDVDDCISYYDALPNAERKDLMQEILISSNSNKVGHGKGCPCD